ncbi:GNAT family N-acetyltransferase [Micromonospora polyrhachis]|uniref:GNAT superfamily N-acetyltransferase n=1 Tax=Micromonospora polyrhachis TaxID=1282883 RepID=A0A7W7STF0_9ACTN|nr:GNAT family N-acetyltransferase [Micromonospora polyrhachis]MBB4960584.1 GNAT superfamily N-acetyltransferase [Micromonospora polyrhachis]
MLIEFRPVTDPELAALVTAQQRELREIDGGLDGQVTVVHDDARHLVGMVDGQAVACGAIQTLGGDTAEIKRMYVRPAHRGRGLSRQLLTALEELALRSGHTVLRLETGSYLPTAIALYASSGYAEIPVYGEYVDNPYSVCFEKHLPVPVPV